MRIRKLGVIGAAGLIAAAMTLGAATTASAATWVTPPDKGSITVTTNETGFVFKACPVDAVVDMTTAVGYDAAVTLAKASTTTYKTVGCTTLTVSSDGKTHTAADLDRGLYQISVVTKPAGVSTSFQTSAVFVPMLDPAQLANNDVMSWINPAISPKDTAGPTIVKSNGGTNVIAGEAVSYTLTGTVKALGLRPTASGEAGHPGFVQDTFTKIVISDDLAGGKLVNVTNLEVKLDTTTLTKVDTCPASNPAANTYSVTAPLTITLCNPGAVAPTADHTVLVTYDAQANVTGLIVNEARIAVNRVGNLGPNGEPGGGDDDEDDDDSAIAYGGVELYKDSSASIGTFLAGATFRVSKAVDGACGANNATGTVFVGFYDTAAVPMTTATPAIPDPTKVVQSVTSTSTGLLIINGLPVDVAKVDEVNVATPTAYCLHETVTPAGFVAPANAVKFTVTPSTPDGAIAWPTQALQATDGADVRIDNIPVAGIPLTGGMGTVLLTVVGVAVLGIGTTVYVVRSRRVAAKA